MKTTEPNQSMQIPDDENGNVLQRMLDGGDTLTQPRMIDYCFKFSTRAQAIAFAEAVPEKEYEVCISYYDDEMWQSIVKKHMTPDHGEISRIESDLSARAVASGGEADGWSCMRITQK
jgi:hypothetical protein